MTSPKSGDSTDNNEGFKFRHPLTDKLIGMPDEWLAGVVDTLIAWHHHKTVRPVIPREPDGPIHAAREPQVSRKETLDWCLSQLDELVKRKAPHSSSTQQQTVVGLPSKMASNSAFCGGLNKCSSERLSVQS